MRTAATPFGGHSILPETRGFLQAPHRLLIGGREIDGSGTLATSDPATGIALAEVHVGGRREIDLAVTAARAAFEGRWGRMPAAERMSLLQRLARLLADKAAFLAELETLDSGMPHAIATLTVANSVELVDYYAGAVLRIEGATTPPPRHIAAAAEALTYTLREPVGVCGLIIPWNVPLAAALLKLAPALAAGCTVVLKPSEETPLSALALGQIVCEAGFPPGVVNVVNGHGLDAGAALAAHPGVDKISFTGSTATGQSIVTAAAGNLKKVSLELGGKSPVVVMGDADLATAIPGVAMAAFFLQGQNCMAGTRVFAHRSIVDALLEGLAGFARGLQPGHGLSPTTQLGPLVSERQAARVMSFINGAAAEGAQLVTGGTRLDRAGHFVAPTIFTDTRPDMRIVREEVFGPVMVVSALDTDDADEIAARANDTEFGLSGSVWTRDLAAAHRIASRIRAGHVSVNCHGAVGTNVPFGGYKKSGWGREFGREALDAYLETKAVTVHLG